jgi:hypothetical protein
MTTTSYYVLRITKLQVCCLLKCGGRIIPIAETSDCVKRFTKLNDAWEFCDEIGAPEGMHPYRISVAACCAS